MSDLRENSENYWKLVSGVLFLGFIYFGWKYTQSELRCNELSTQIEVTDSVFIENFSNQAKRIDTIKWFNQMGVRFENE